MTLFQIIRNYICVITGIVLLAGLVKWAKKKSD